MERVAIIGCGGSGKSTLARRLGARTGLPVTHLDRVFWRPGWVPTPEDEWRAMQVELVATDRWILDGNYSRTLDVRLPRADTVLFLDVATWRTLSRVLWRTLRDHGKDIQADGCPEKFEWSFIKWVATYRRRSRPRVIDAIANDAAHARVHVLRRPRDVERFVSRLDPADHSA
jgi:adenylate kinase family enzyme